MSMEEVKRLYSDLSTNAELQAKFSKLNPSASKDDINLILSEGVKLANLEGYDISIDDIKKYLEENSCIVSEESLDAVAGGGTCACVIGGGGTGTGHLDRSTDIDLTCACVYGGGGEGFDRKGDRRPRCVCVIAGGGTGWD